MKTKPCYVVGICNLDDNSASARLHWAVNLY